MKCPYKQTGRNEDYCWYKNHEGTCNFIQREWGCPIARHYEMNRRMIIKGMIQLKQLESSRVVHSRGSK